MLQDAYDEKAEKDEEEKRREKKKRETGSTYIRRVIVHPAFQNISFKEAEKLLKDMDQGDTIIRPSSKGSDHLTVTWKVIQKPFCSEMICMCNSLPGDGRDLPAH